ncbi:MAG: chromosomal replication initiator protein DnaA [Chloroflexi bacterium]|nr:chromosomal replication initiator protein DnaA [Chloroflexota bacterium]
MHTDAGTLWRETLTVLSQHLSRANYETWLEGTEGLRLEESRLVVGTRSEFVTEWLRKRLRPLVLRTIADLAEQPLDIDFEPLPSEERSPPEALRAPDSPQGAGAADPGADPLPPPPRLRKRYTFEKFISGPGTRLAVAAAESVARDPGHLYNPLFLYGAAGLGKTHLLHAIGHGLADRGYRATYISAEQFTNQLIGSIQERTQGAFRARYRSATALLIDDIQFIAGKEQTQEEFFHTFNELYEAGRQIVISSDQGPSSIPQLEERLRTRFQWGMTADLQPPDVETRIAILRSKTADHDMSVPDGVLELIAARFTSNIRELEGSLTRVIAYSRLTGEPLTPALLQSALAALEPSASRLPPSPSLIIGAVCRYFELDERQLLSRSREKRVAYPRQIAMYLIRELAHRSLVEIGATLGGRDHSTIHHGWQKMDRALHVDPETKRDVATIRELIEQSRRSA